ncbi:hypothetical protein COU74_04510 [Candidatus Peregrinibacteria bacterium CG10_big_fil_rev_8_21_14_0_10_36_19]|nr:MAG: hypothetical protein COU74_04510 [Candidatus Peregrinibacteria bacterium CG10_big_fil_rev_8_21_14_0_10_36_19]
MKKIVFLLISLLLISCTSKQESFDVDNYVAPELTKIEEGEYQGYYVNQRFGFRFLPLSDYEIVGMPSGEGATMSKRIAGVDYLKEDKEGNRYPYNVEVKVMAFDNVLEFDDLADFIQARYPGYTIEGYDGENISGFFVDEGRADDAVRHFFTMKDDVIYEASLKLPSYYFVYHKQGFDDFVKTIVFF